MFFDYLTLHAASIRVVIAVPAERTTTMQSILCSKPACSNLAAWQRADSLDAIYVPHYLCEQHDDLLFTEQPLRAYHYDRIEDAEPPIPAEDAENQRDELLLVS